MNKFWIGLGIFAAVLFGLLYWLAWVVLEKFEMGQVRFWAALLTAGLPFQILMAYGVGFYLGKVEARGALSGIDQATERIARVVGQTVNVRDASRIRVQNQVPHQAGPVVLFPVSDHPQITHRNERGTNEMIDLDY